MPTPIATLEAIADARQAVDDLSHFANENKVLIDQYRELESEAAARVAAAKTSLAANHEVIDESVVDGWKLSYPTKVNLERLIDLVPAVVDMDIIKQTVTKGEYDKLVKAGEVTPRQQLEIEQQAETPTITKPKGW